MFFAPTGRRPFDPAAGLHLHNHTHVPVAFPRVAARVPVPGAVGRLHVKIAQDLELGDGSLRANGVGSTGLLHEGEREGGGRRKVFPRSRGAVTIVTMSQ
eukprot:scaffold29624_cov30-Tisochrysis_lutea.AAC.1